MDLQGKKINFLGDSITQGYCAASLDRGFVDLMKEQYQLGAARNYGIGGTRIARQMVPSEEPLFDQDFCSRAAQMDHDADVILVFGGTNDHGHGDAPMGAPDDRTPDTFVGACHCLYETLLSEYPAANIVVLTPLHRIDEDRPKGERGWRLYDYVNQIKTIAAKHSLTILDLYECSAIQAHLPEVAARLTTDGLHPNDEGHAILAREIGEFLKTL